jgi:hypothetical protein
LLKQYTEDRAKNKFEPMRPLSLRELAEKGIKVQLQTQALIQHHMEMTFKSGGSGWSSAMTEPPSHEHEQVVRTAEELKQLLDRLEITGEGPAGLK